MLTFNVECTLPPPGTTFVRPPDVRGTLDIVYSCLTIIVLCTWSIMPLNVPTQYKSTPGRQTHMRTMRRTLNKLSWLAFNILGPEWPFVKAVNSWRNAKKLERKFDIYRGIDDVTWTRSHTQLANMGGFVIIFGPGAQVLAGQVDLEEVAHPTACIGGSCGVPLRPWWSHADRLQTHRRTMRQDSPQSTESMMTDRRSSYEDPENAQHGIPLVTSDESASPVSDYVRSMLRAGLACGWGCPHVLERPRSCGNIGWHLDAINTANARLSYEDLDRGHLDDKIQTHILSQGTARWLTTLRALCGDRWYLDANQLLLARELGIIGKLPKLSTERVSDLSKEDIFVKLLAISQIIWLCLQLSMRLGQGVPTTQLEVMTMGYALCSALTYFLLFDRPRDVTTVFEVEAARYPTSNEMSLVASVGPNIFGFSRSTVSVPNNSRHQNGQFPDMALSSSFAVFLFGVMHFAAWGYEFPTQTERDLWRASTALTIAVVPAIFAAAFVARRFSSHPGRSVSRERVEGLVALVQLWIFAPLFIAARSFILVEVIRSLVYQPPESYKTTWAAYVPHVG